MRVKAVTTVAGYITLLITDDGILCCIDDDHYNDTILPGQAYQLGVYLVEKYRPAEAPKESGLPLAVEVLAHKALLDAALVCQRLSREASERRDRALSEGRRTNKLVNAAIIARNEQAKVDACLDCGEAILALVPR